MARKHQGQQEQPQRVYIGYCRVSTDEQAENGHGLDAQEARVRAYARAIGWELMDVIKDDGYSGASMNRPGLQQLLGMVRTGQVAGVVVAKLDRVSRSLRDMLNLYAECFEASNTALVSVTEQFDTSTPAGRLFFQLVGSFAEFERNVITERTSGGRKSKAAKGGYAGGGAPIGYRAVRGSKVLTLDAEKVATVRRVFELDAQDLSCRQIALALNQEGHRTAKGTEFTHVQVSRILKRRALYAGGYSYAGVEAEQGQHTAIL